MLRCEFLPSPFCGVESITGSFAWLQNEQFKPIHQLLGHFASH
jgi:hypothetical protein